MADGLSDKRLQGLTSESGDIVVYGRQIHWKASGYFRGLHWRYKATATDKATGVQGSASNYKSGKGAVEHATKDLFEKLIAGGYIPIGVAVARSVAAASSSPKGSSGPVATSSDEPAPDATVSSFWTMPEGLSDERLQGVTSESGDIVVYGRQIHWTASGYFRGLHWRYKATATDKATGVQGSASNFKSGKGAVEAATKDLFEKLIAGGYIPTGVNVAAEANVAMA